MSKQRPYEIIAREDWEPGTRKETTCRGCGRRILLWWNQGKLDAIECCGYEYVAHHVMTELLVRRRKAA